MNLVEPCKSCTNQKGMQGHITNRCLGCSSLCKAMFEKNKYNDEQIQAFCKLCGVSYCEERYNKIKA